MKLLCGWHVFLLLSFWAIFFCWSSRTSTFWLQYWNWNYYVWSWICRFHLLCENFEVQLLYIHFLLGCCKPKFHGIEHNLSTSTALVGRNLCSIYLPFLVRTLFFLCSLSVRFVILSLFCKSFHRAKKKKTFISFHA